MKRLLPLMVICLVMGACSSSDQFTGWQTEQFDLTQITESDTKTFILGNASTDQEQHIRAIAFDRGSNTAGHFRMDEVKVGDQVVDSTDIVVPPSSALTVTVTYTPRDMETTHASYGGWTTGEPERWTPRHPDEAAKWGEEDDEAIHRAIMLAVYDHPNDGIFYIQLVGTAMKGPHGEDEIGAGSVNCVPGGGIACYTGGFAVDIPELAPGGPKPLELTGPIRIDVSGGAATLAMEDFPYAVMYLRSSEVPQLQVAGVTVTLVISGAEGYEATGTFDGSRLTLKDVALRIRVAFGELTTEQIKQGMSAVVDFEVPGLEITTIKPLAQGEITLHTETKLPNDPSGNEIFDQLLSGANVIAVMEGELNL